jgi:branched-chain amino acid transport system substrate-binding protein
MTVQQITRKRNKFWVAILPVMLSVSMFSGEADAQGKPPLKIGAFLSVTGAASYLGSGEMKTLELYTDLINKAGGVDGRKIELYAYDDETDAARANTLVKRMINNDKVHAIIGGSTTGTTMSGVPLAERAGIPMLSLAGGSVIIDPIKKFVFKMNHTDATAVTKVYDHMLSQGIKNIGIIAGTDAFGRAALVAAQKIAPEKGMKILREESFNPKDTDMTAQLTKLRQEPGIQAILNLGFGEPAVMVARSYRQLGIDLPHYGTHSLASDTFIKLAGPAAEGMIMTNGAILVSDQLAANDPQRPVVQGYVKSYKEKFGEAPSFFGGNAYDALMLIKNAVQKSGSTDPQKIRDGIEKNDAYLGVTGAFRMSETDHVGLTAASLKVVRVKDGKWILIQ